MDINTLVLLELDVGKHNKVKDASFPKDQLKKGIEIEKEHSNNPEIQKAIAKDHLAEMPNYYSFLPKMEKQAKKAIKNK